MHSYVPFEMPSGKFSLIIATFLWALLDFYTSCFIPIISKPSLWNSLFKFDFQLVKVYSVLLTHWNSDWKWMTALVRSVLLILREKVLKSIFFIYFATGEVWCKFDYVWYKQIPFFQTNDSRKTRIHLCQETFLWHKRIFLWVFESKFRKAKPFV